MTRKRHIIFICFLFILTGVLYSGAGGAGLCSQIFSKRKGFFELQTFNNPLTTILAEGYLTAKKLKWFNSQKRARELESGLKETAQLLEANFERKETLNTTSQDILTTQPEQLRNLNIPLEKVINKVPEIIKFVEQSPVEESAYFRKIGQAVLAVFGKHIPSLLKEKPEQVDWARINLIVKNIADFNPQDPRFSLYKIKRAIEGRYSLKEFILCRM